MMRVSFATAVVAMLGIAAVAVVAHAAARNIERGRYLVTVIACGDCHTPGGLVGKPDPKRDLAGSEVGLAVPGLGVFYGSNLTPDRETGLGRWTVEQIAVVIRSGRRPDGRRLAPAMPVASYRHLTAADALAIAAYLKSLPPVHNEVPGPFGPDQKPTSTSLVMTVVPAEIYWRGPHPRR